MSLRLDDEGDKPVNDKDKTRVLARHVSTKRLIHELKNRQIECKKNLAQIGKEVS